VVSDNKLSVRRGFFFFSGNGNDKSRCYEKPCFKKKKKMSEHLLGLTGELLSFE